MPTTLNLDDELVHRLQSLATATGRTLDALVEEAIRTMLAEGPEVRKETSDLQWETFEGRLRPGVDLDDRDALYDLMDGIPRSGSDRPPEP